MLMIEVEEKSVSYGDLPVGSLFRWVAGGDVLMKTVNNPSRWFNAFNLSNYLVETVLPADQVVPIFGKWEATELEDEPVPFSQVAPFEGLVMAGAPVGPSGPQIHLKMGPLTGMGSALNLDTGEYQNMSGSVKANRVGRLLLKIKRL
jgi:hypothetical protein